MELTKRRDCPEGLITTSDYDFYELNNGPSLSGEGPRILTSKPFSSSAKIGMTYTTGAANTGLWQTGSNNTQGFVDGLNRTFNFFFTSRGIINNQYYFLG